MFNSNVTSPHVIRSLEKEQVLRSSGPRRDKKPNFLKNRAKVRLIGWTKLGWNYFIVTYHRVKNSKYVIYRHL